MSAALKAAIQRTGRSCGTCSLCCKLPEIVVLNKPANTWCQHRTPGNGCGIYQTRPTKCQNFGCGWLTDTGFGDVWFPARAKMYLTFTPAPDGRLDHLLVVDPAWPNRWREAPYLEALKRMATRRRVVVSVGVQAFVVRADTPEAS
jgi:uncharacterized protein